MLFHVTARHDARECQMYNETTREALQAYLLSLPERVRELNVKIHYAVNGEPGHVFFLLLEADDVQSICGLLGAIPLRQEFDIQPVRTFPFGSGGTGRP